MTPNEIMRDLERDDIFPKAAMAAALENPALILPRFLELIDRLNRAKLKDIQDRDLCAVIPVFHMLGQLREPRAYRPLLKLFQRPTEILDEILGDALTETGYRVIAGTFDGEFEPIFDAIENSKADEFARSALFDALVLIAKTSPEHKAEVSNYFRQFRNRCKEENSDVLVGWIEGIVDLGLTDMEPEVRATFDAGVIPSDYCSPDDVLNELHRIAETGQLPTNHRYDRGLITDCIAELSTWHGYSQEYLAPRQSKHFLNPSFTMSSQENLAGDHRLPGRNDPCICGSGKKFKKCCLQ